MDKILHSYKTPLGHSVHIEKKTYGPVSGKPKNRLAIISGLHGDELEGIALCGKLVSYLSRLEEENPEAIRGQIEIYPTANPQSLASSKRLWPMGDLDMNRQFGGNGKSLLSDISKRILKDIIQNSDIAIDIHAGNLFLKELPQVRIIEGYEKKLIPLASQCNVDLIWVHPIADFFKLTLGFNLNKARVRTIVIEAGVGARLDKEIGDQLFFGVIQFMRSIEVLDCEEPIVQKKKPILVNPDEVKMAASNTSGFFVPDINLGKWIKKDDLIGKIICPNNGNVLEEIVVSSDGLVFTLRENPMAYEGSVVARIANKELAL
jgi:uncharacterized protein